MRMKEVLERLNVTRMTLNNYVKAGKIKVKQRLSKRLFIYDDESIEKFLEKSSKWTKSRIVEVREVSSSESMNFQEVNHI